MRLKRVDAQAIRYTLILVNARNNKTITDAEIAGALFDNLYWCETDDGIRQCVAVLPQSVWASVRFKIGDTLKNVHPGELFAYAPFTPTATELKKLDARVRHLMSVVTEYLDNPTGVVAFEIDDPHNWRRFRQLATVSGEPCRKPDCSADRVRLAVYCLEHQFDMLYGELPPLI